MNRLTRTLAIPQDAVSVEAVFVVDADQRIVSWNQEAASLLGYPPDRALGALCYRLIGASDEAGRRFCRAGCPVIAAASRGRAIPPLEIRARTGSGEPLDLSVSTVLLLSADGERTVIHLCRRVGASGTPRPAGPPFRLTRRERQILGCFCDGTTTTEEVAGLLGISPATVRNEVQHLLEKLAVHTRAEAVALAYRHRLV